LSITSTGFYFWRLKILLKLHRKPSLPQPFVSCSDQNISVRIAFICDEMTWKSFAPLCAEAIFVPSECWQDVLTAFKPDLLFCESAWHGIEEYPESWRSQIFRNHSVKFENRKTLFDILHYCRQHQIKTVFWNKEDPTYFDHPQYDFSDTALRFDYVFTTAQECAEQYRQRGHEQVDLLPFGFSPEIFNPLGRSEDASNAVYCGSWFSEHQKRCEDMETLFAWVKARSMPLTIYDRQKNGEQQSSFPEKYRDIVHPAAPYKTLGEIYRNSGVGININTVTNSSTMFARRVLEMMACALPVVSNASTGLQMRFGEKICIPECGGREIPTKEDVHALVREVFVHDTVDKRLETVLKKVGLWKETGQPWLDVYCIGHKAEQLFCLIQWTNKRLICVQDESELPELIRQSESAYLIVLDQDSQCPDISFWLTQFSFLPDGCGVGYGENLYRIESVDKWCGILWANSFKNERYQKPAKKYSASLFK